MKKNIYYKNECLTDSGTAIIRLTQAEYDALTEEQKMADVIYMITDADSAVSVLELDKRVSEVEADNAELNRNISNNWTKNTPIYLLQDNRTSGNHLKYTADKPCKVYIETALEPQDSSQVNYFINGVKVHRFINKSTVSGMYDSVLLDLDKGDTLSSADYYGAYTFCAMVYPK